MGLGVRFLAGVRNFSHLHNVHTSSGAHPVQWILVAVSSAVMQQGREPDRPLTPIYCRCLRMVQLYLHSPIRLHGVALN
jgi:hypothetical protein